MTATSLLVRAHRPAWRDAVELLVVAHDDKILRIAQPLIMELVEDGAAIIEPTLTLSMHAAQLLMDELWGCGLRPSEGTGSAGSLAATERHLRDMQTIAMGLLRKDGTSV